MTETTEKKKYVVKIGFGDGDCLPVFETEDPKEAYRKAWDLAYENQCVDDAAKERYEMFDDDEDRYPHEPVSDEDRYRLGLPGYITHYSDLEDYYDPRNRFENSWEVEIEYDGYTLCWFDEEGGDRHPEFCTDTEDEGYPMEELKNMRMISIPFRKHYNGYEFRKGVEYQYRYIWRERVRVYGEDHGYRMTSYDCDYSLLPELKLPSDDELEKEYYRDENAAEWVARRALEGYNVEADFNCLLCTGIFRKI